MKKKRNEDKIQKQRNENSDIIISRSEAPKKPKGGEKNYSVEKSLFYFNFNFSFLFNCTRI